MSRYFAKVDGFLDDGPYVYIEVRLYIVPHNSIDIRALSNSVIIAHRILRNVFIKLLSVCPAGSCVLRQRGLGALEAGSEAG